jgi:hypothetical protein
MVNVCNVQNGNFIYYLHYMLHMFTPTFCAFSQPLYHVCADFPQRVGIDSSTRVSNSLPLAFGSIPDDH